MGSFAEYGFQKTGRRMASAGFCWLHRVVGPYARWRSFIRLQLMKPYSKLKSTISTCPMGFPLALKISDVTPISEAASVR